MALKMPGPVAFAPSYIFHLNVRVPKDLAAKLRGKQVTLPIAGEPVTVRIGDKVLVSLRTRQAKEARTRFATAFAALEAHWEAVRIGPRPLSDEQIVALAGEAYRGFVEQVEPKLGLGAFEGKREAHQEAIEAIRFGDPIENILGGFQEVSQEKAEDLAILQLPHGPFLLAWYRGCDINSATIDVTYVEALEHLFGQRANAVVAKHQLVLDDATRLKLLRQIGTAVIAGTARLKQITRGDYSPDPYLARFPAFDRDPCVTVAILFERWQEKKKGVVAASTIRRYTPSLNSLAAFLKSKDVRRITQDDIWDWAEYRRDVDAIAPATVNRNDLVAAGSIFTFATTRDGKRLRLDNPVDGVKLEAPKKQRTREPFFRPAEVKAILELARSVEIGGLHARQAASRRWVPWICAYAGARVQEPCWMRKEHVRQDAETGIWVMRFPQTKTGNARTVPIHEALIEEGFLEFVDAAPDGLLFVDESRPRKGKTRTIQEQRASQIAEWIGEHVALEDGVDPNHGWRHTFITRATGKMDKRIQNAICGHNEKQDVSDGYFTATIVEMKAGLDKLPRYKLELCGRKPSNLDSSGPCRGRGKPTAAYSCARGRVPGRVADLRRRCDRFERLSVDDLGAAARALVMARQANCAATDRLLATPGDEVKKIEADRVTSCLQALRQYCTRVFRPCRAPRRAGKPRASSSGSLASAVACLVPLRHISPGTAGPGIPTNSPREAVWFAPGCGAGRWRPSTVRTCESTCRVFSSPTTSKP